MLSLPIYTISRELSLTWNILYSTLHTDYANNDLLEMQVEINQQQQKQYKQHTQFWIKMNQRTHVERAHLVEKTNNENAY